MNGRFSIKPKLLLLIVILLGGCGSDSKNDKSKQDSNADLETKSLAEKLVGRWKVNREASARLTLKKFPRKQEDRIKARSDEEVIAAMAKVAPEVEIEFRKDGQCTFRTRDGDPKELSYTVEDKGDHLIVKFSGSADVPGETRGTFENDDQVILDIIGEGQQGISLLDRVK